MKTVAIIAARMGSTRLPGKVLFDLGGKKVLRWVMRAALAAPGIDEVWVATTTDPRDEEIIKFCTAVDIPYWRGSERDVLKRFADCAKKAEADVVVRLTGDCPFLDPLVIGACVTLRHITNADYAQNVSPADWPDGLDVEAFAAGALFAADHEATRASDRDCLTQFLERHRSRFRSEHLACPIPGLWQERWVLDTAEDYDFCRAVIARLPRARPWSYLDIINVLERDPVLRLINSMHNRNERFFEAVSHE